MSNTPVTAFRAGVLSLVLVAMSLYIRMSLAESPLFQSIKASGTSSTAPLRESFGNWSNLKIVLLVLGCMITARTAVDNAGPIK